jgi:tetratricopeptide (TPR) repeat protein
VKQLLATAVLAAALFLALRAEVRRYAAERRLGRAELLIVTVARGGLPDNRAAAALAAASDLLENLDDLLPDDPGAPLAAGSLALLRGHPEQALAEYRLSVARGERAETDLSLSRAHAALKDFEGASEAALRAVWIDPFLIPTMPQPIRRPLRETVRRLEHQLEAGQLRQPPQLPAEDRPVGGRR